MSKVDKLVLGTVQMGISGYGINSQSEGLSLSDSKEILKQAKALNIGFLDTAAAYGTAEEVIGEYNSHAGQDQFNIITKFSSKYDWQTSLTRSLHNLKLERLHGLMFHSYKDYCNSGSRIDEILSVGKNKFFKQLGVSVYDNEELELVMTDDRIDFIQAPFNLLDNELQRAHIFNSCRKLGKEIHTRSVYLQGLFFMNEASAEPRLKPLLQKLRTAKDQLDRLGINIGSLALNYALSKPYIDKVLVGVDSLHHLNQSISWLEDKIPYRLFEQIDQIAVEDRDFLNPSKWKL